MTDISSIFEGNVKFRDGKKWKSRWCVMRKLSPVADCLHLQLYRDSKDRYKNGPTKASLSLQHFLGVESGFTLDKESNTIAIICQDVIVVLAFDSREKLIQWQVKISTNLGDDIQYLVLVSSAPSKSKLSTGPARMHIQDHRFCLTIGVPPRLAGLWDIGHLRRYGVVDGRFCFEGGSSCGKGEGLYVFVTDQSDEITHSLKLASQGRLVTKRRPIARKASTTDSPRRTITSTIPDVIHEHSCISQIKNSSNDQNNIMCHQFGGSNNTSSYWPSQESRDLDSQFGCGDTNSVIEVNDSFNDSDINSKHIVNIERCMSCISKLGGPSISRSSTATGGTPMCNMHQHHQHQHQQHNQIHNNQNQNPILDNMSLGSHGSSSNSSEYSVPRTINCKVISQTESWYEKAPTFQIDEITRTSSPCQCFHNQQHQAPNRPPKPKPHQKPPMPLPTTQQPTAISTHIGPYENYDIPKPQPYIIEAENYDTPKKIKEVLSGTNTSCTSPDVTYGNYDMPLSVTKTICGCGFLNGENVTSKKDEIELEKTHIDCTCNRVMSWTDNWITLPLCRRGNGIENTGVPINRVKLSGEGRMPVMKPSGELAIYATVDMTKKISRRLAEMENSSCECTNEKQDDDCNDNDHDHGNYSNIDTTQLNYANLDFEKSLENYENAKEILAKLHEDKCIEDETTGEIIKVCHKCRFHKSASNEKLCENEDENIKQDDYMMMEPGKTPNASGYIPMQPVANNHCSAPPLPSKTEILKRLLNDKSASNPTLCGPAVDRSRKRCKNERITGTAMMLLCRNAGSPYNRKQLMDSTDLLPFDKRLMARKRSSSAESSNLVDLVDEIEIETQSRKSSVNTVENRRSSSPCLHQETELCEDESCCTKVSVVSSENDEISTSTTTNTTITTTTSSQHHLIQNQNYIRRSASVPCKGQNRDSSSSNDSGVSTSSLRHRGGDFNELELPLSNSLAIKKYQRYILPALTCVHSSLPRRSKSFDPLREISFQFQRIKIPEKSTSAEAEVPVCPPKGKGFNSPGDPSLTGVPYIDSRSTSSGTSDMSDYIETLSLSSHSSSDTPEGMKLIRHQPTSTLRPRSGKEYQNIDRSLICLQQNSDKTTAPLVSQSSGNTQTQQVRGLLPMSANYANITPVPENVESPSPGYQSGGSPQELGPGEHFTFKNETTTNT